MEEKNLIISINNCEVILKSGINRVEIPHDLSGNPIGLVDIFKNQGFIEVIQEITLYKETKTDYYSITILEKDTILVEINDRCNKDNITDLYEQSRKEICNIIKDYLNNLVATLREYREFRRHLSIFYKIILDILEPNISINSFAFTVTESGINVYIGQLKEPITLSKVIFNPNYHYKYNIKCDILNMIKNNMQEKIIQIDNELNFMVPEEE
jgi:hypothetical protein